MQEFSVRLSLPITKEQILKLFQKHGYIPNVMINKEKMYKVLNDELNKNPGGSINQELVDEAWIESQGTASSLVSINKIADIILKVQSALEAKIEKLSNNDGILSQLERGIKDKQQVMREHMDYNGDDRTKVTDLAKEVINMKVQQKQNQFDLQNFTSDYETLNKIFNQDRNPSHFTENQTLETQQYPLTHSPPEKLIQSNTEVHTSSPAAPLNLVNQSIHQPLHESIHQPIYEPVPLTNSLIQSKYTEPIVTQSIPLQPILISSAVPQNVQSTLNNQSVSQQNPHNLLLALNFTFLMTAFQLLIMSSLRVSMLTLTAYLHTLYILLFGMSGSDSITYLLIHNGISIAADIIFLLVKFLSPADLMPYQYSSFTIYIIFLILLLTVTIVIRGIVIRLLLPFRTNSYNVNYHQNFEFMGHVFPLLPSVVDSAHQRNTLINDIYNKLPESLPLFSNSHTNSVEPYSTIEQNLRNTEVIADIHHNGQKEPFQFHNLHDDNILQQMNHTSEKYSMLRT